MTRIPKVVQDLLLTLFFALVIGALVAAFQPGPFTNAWVPSSLLFWFSFFIGLRLWRELGSSRNLAALLLVTFFLRLILGVFLHTSLPALGFDNDVQNSGFVYSDAYARDTQGFELANSGASLFSAFSQKQHSDQYGGLLFLTAAIYRFLSSDVSRPLMISILGAYCMSIGLAFLYHTLRNRWGGGVALVAGWFYALYPEGVLLGSSQMREPFLIGLFCVGFWAALNWRKGICKNAIIMALTIGAALLFSLPFGGALSGLLILVIVVDWLSEQTTAHRRLIGWIVFILLAGIFVTAGWLWLKPTIYYDAYLTERASGYFQALLKQLGGEWLIPFTALSGVTQPLLPAALLYRSLPVWMTVASVRAIGWYFAIPFMVYAFFAVWKPKGQKRSWVLILAAVSMAAWVCVATLRAGGDQWDNPRYRALLIPWLAMIVGWGWQRVRDGFGRWFFRWLAAEIVFLIGLTVFYLSRYDFLNAQISFFPLAAGITGLSLLIILSGLIFDLVKARNQLHENARSMKREK